MLTPFGPVLSVLSHLDGVPSDSARLKTVNHQVNYDEIDGCIPERHYNPVKHTSVVSRVRSGLEMIGIRLSEWMVAVNDKALNFYFSKYELETGVANKSDELDLRATVMSEVSVYTADYEWETGVGD